MEWSNTLVMPEVLVPLPHPTYRLPREWFILRRIRRRQIPVPRSPFMHFLSDCISQHTSAVENRTSYRGAIDTILEIWLKMSNEQRMPWIQMAQKDMIVITRLVPYYAECLRRGRRIASRPRDGGSANERSHVIPVVHVDHPTLLHGSFEVPVGPQTPLPPIVLFHGRRPVVFVQPMIVFDQTGCRPCTCLYERQQDKATTVSEVTLISGPELPFLEAHRARYATSMRSTYQSQSQDTNHDQHEDSEVNCPGSTDPFTTVEPQDNSSDSPDEQVELTFLEAQRNRYATPVRTTHYPCSTAAD